MNRVKLKFRRLLLRSRLLQRICFSSGVPSPPSNLQLTDCYHRHTNLSWTPASSNSSHIKHYLIEQETNHHPSVFKLIYNVTNPDVTSVSLTLPGWSTLRFRVRAVNTVGPSRPSVATAGEICTTPVESKLKYTISAILMTKTLKSQTSTPNKTE